MTQKGQHQEHRTPTQQAKLIAKILVLEANGLSTSQGLEALKADGDLISRSQYQRYRNKAMAQLVEDLKADRKALAGTLLHQKRDLFKAAMTQYTRTQDPRQGRLAVEVHRDLTGFQQDLGLVDKGAQKLEVSGELSIKEWLKGVMKPKEEKKEAGA